MKLGVLLFVVVVMVVLAAPKAQAQQHQARDWHCVRQSMAEDTDGNVTALQCEAALPKGEKLDTEDEDNLSKLAKIRYSVQSLAPKPSSADTGKGKETVDALRMGFGQAVGQLCQKHPNIVLAPLFPDLNTSQPKLYRCKNIIAAPEK